VRQIHYVLLIRPVLPALRAGTALDRSRALRLLSKSTTREGERGKGKGDGRDKSRVVPGVALWDDPALLFPVGVQVRFGDGGRVAGVAALHFLEPAARVIGKDVGFTRWDRSSPSS
jgi:hypothetical protein